MAGFQLSINGRFWVSTEEKLDWMEVGISQNQSGAVEKGIYVPADEYRGFDGTPIGIHLVLDQRGNRIENPEWHLHQDFVTTLG